MELTEQNRELKTVATALVAPGESALPVPAAAVASPEPAWQPGLHRHHPDLDRLGDQIAELSARIQAATYELQHHRSHLRC